MINTFTVEKIFFFYSFNIVLFIFDLNDNFSLAPMTSTLIS